jgi:TRAP-type C4-dicarboxylate transport system permease small subunit
MRLLRHLYDNLEEYVCAFLIGVMVMCLILQVAVRMTTGSALAWTEELSRFSFVWGVYIGTALAAKRVAHVRINAQFLFAPVKVRLFFRILADAVWVGFNLFFVFHGCDAVMEALAFPERSVTLGWTKGYVEMIVPLGFAMMSWRTIEVYIKKYRTGTLYSLVSLAQDDVEVKI